MGHNKIRLVFQKLMFFFNFGSSCAYTMTHLLEFCHKTTKRPSTQVAGEPLDSVQLESLRQNIAVVPQVSDYIAVGAFVTFAKPKKTDYFVRVSVILVSSLSA